MNLTYLIENRLKSVKLITITFLIVGLIFSLKLWVGERQFPLIPCIDGLEGVLYSFNYVLFLLLILSLLYEIYKPNKWSLAAGLFSLFLFLLQDQNRLQPWVYIYILILLPFWFSNFLKSSERNLITPFKIIFIAMYFWSGVQKANSNFVSDGFLSILVNLLKIQDPLVVKNLLPLGYAIPAVEIFIAVSLMTKKLRDLGVFLAVFTHIFILIYISPVGINGNYIIFPWNIAMILLVIALFYKHDANIKILDKTNVKTTFFNYFYSLLLGLLPMLNFWGKWDDYLSFSLYSERSNLFYIAISDKYIGQFGNQFDDCFLKLDDNIRGGKVINVNKWAVKTLNVPLFPEIRAFEKISKSFCQYNIPDTDMIFLMYKGSVKNENLTKWTCEQIK
jgi:hypothetical protein